MAMEMQSLLKWQFREFESSMNDIPCEMDRLLSIYFIAIVGGTRRKEGGWDGNGNEEKLLEFTKWVQTGATNSKVMVEGDLSGLEPYRHPENTPWIITLDSDTLLPRDAAQRLVGVASHPLNRVELDEWTHQVVRGYTIFQPRVSLHTGEQKRTRYLELHTAHSGLDPYVSAASDVYQDLFREGSFTGKGIFDLRRFEMLLDGVFPENRILSHDLIEGCHVRVG